jgi:hypothetical protein
MRVATGIKNIPISFSVLHEIEYDNLHLFLKKNHDKKRSTSARQPLSNKSLIKLTDPKFASIQMSRLEVAV